jgi:hypothetical protein
MKQLSNCTRDISHLVDKLRQWACRFINLVASLLDACNIMWTSWEQAITDLYGLLAQSLNRVEIQTQIDIGFVEATLWAAEM